MSACRSCGAELRADDAFCAKCGTAVSDVQLDFATHARAAVVGHRADLPPVKCPKCGHRQHNPEACDRCGLVFALAPTGPAPWDRPPAGKEVAYTEAAALWEVVEADHTNKEAHARFCEHCKTNGIIEFASRRYRHRLGDYPDDATAQHFNADIVATAQLIAQNYQVSEQPIDPQAIQRVLTVVVGIVVMVLILVFALVWR